MGAERLQNPIDAEEDVVMNRKAWVVCGAVLGAAAFSQAALAIETDPSTNIEGMPHNGLSSAAFRLNALTTNATALGTLVRLGLSDALVRDPYIARQLQQGHARAMLQEMAACALDAAAPPLVYTVPGAGQFQATGEVGLCPEARQGPLSSDCQELITACVTARVNALVHSIPISLRGTAPALASRRPAVLTDRRFRESQAVDDPRIGLPIASFSAPGCGAGHECGWQPAQVGTCRPNTEVALAISDPAVCASAVLRVCSGLHGCMAQGAQEPRPAKLPQLPDPVYYEEPPRQQQRGACASAPLTFTCPADLGVAGYFSAMVLSADPAPHPAPAVIQVRGTGSFPAPEADVFGFLEGAYYGNLFDPSQLTRSCELASDGSALDCSPGPASAARAPTPATCRAPIARPGISATGVPVAAGEDDSACLSQAPAVPYGGVYACYSYAQQTENAADDDVSAAAINARICDVPHSGRSCFGDRLRRCHYSDENKNLDLQHSAGCKALPAGGGYPLCRGVDAEASRTYSHVVTTYLNEPCDLLATSGECSALGRTLAASAGGATPATGVGSVGPGKRGCGGCAAGGGGLPGLVAGVALVALRRRKSVPVR